MTPVHPGVTTRWTGAIGIAGYYLPSLSWGKTGLEVAGVPLVQAYHPTMDLLAAARRPTILLTALAVVAAYLLLHRRVGAPTALVAALFLALDPFFVALSRVLHHDALNAVFALLSVLCLVEALASGRWRWYVAAGAGAGLAFLSKSPSIVLPVLAMVAALLSTMALPPESRRWNRVVAGLAVMVGAMGLTTFALWPAMWTDPLGAIQAVYNTASAYAALPHDSGNFFWGRAVADPGLLFYPTALLFRGAPLTLVGAAISLAFLPAWWKSARRSAESPLPLALALWGLTASCIVVLTLGAKKFDRYALPSLLALDGLAALGWVALLGAVRRRWLPSWASARVFRTAVGLGAVTMLATGALCLSYYPYYLTYYNPMLGGGASAVNTLLVGWGEGLDQVMGYLNSATDGKGARIGGALAAVLNDEPYTVYPFPPEPQRNDYPWAQLDYVVTTVKEQQRGKSVPRAFGDLFAATDSTLSVWLSGIKYASIYRVRPEMFLSLPPQTTSIESEFPGQVRLKGYRLYPMEISPQGERILPVTLYWQVRDPCAQAASLVLKLVNGVSTVWASATDSVPWGSQICERQRAWRGDLIFPDEHLLKVYPGTPPGSYQVQVLVMEKVGTEWSPMGGGSLLLGPIEMARDLRLRVDDLDMEHEIGATLGGRIRFLGYTVSGGTKPGQRLEFTAFWQCVAPVEESYKVFLHVVDKDGQLLAQQDGEPVTGFYPTNLWRVGEIVRDQHSLEFTDNRTAAATGFRLGLYQPATGQRLAVTLADGKVPEDRAVALP